MIVYRISNPLYSKDISGTGAKLLGGRWNSKGIPVLYVSEHVSLAVLEMLVNTKFQDYAISLDLIIIQIPDTAQLTEININKIKKGWIEDFGYTAYIGDEFIKDKQSLLLKIPSAVITEEHNYLINPLHADFKKIKVLEIRSFKTDKRLFSI